MRYSFNACRRSLVLGSIFLGFKDFALSAPIIKKTIRLIVPFPPGGATDIMARGIAQGLANELEQSVIVENKGGAGGSIAAEFVAHATPDGTTLLFTTMGIMSINPSLYPKLKYDPIKDFTPISLTHLTPRVVVVNSSLPIKTVADLIAYAQSKPGQLTYGSAGNGSSSHLSGALFESLAKINLLHIPYKGSALLLTDLIAGRVSMAFDAYAVYEEHIKSGKLRLIAITSKKRMPWLPNTPTVSESGLPSYEVANWLGVVAPAGLPSDIGKSIHTALVKIMSSNSMKQQLFELGIEPTSSTPDEFIAIIQSENIKWAEIVKKMSVSID
jgi:tripartite-type tricarboxylate transporter receptor subunit TctC